MARLVRRKCPCLRPKMEEEVRVLDYRHSSLTDVPSEVFNWERTLEELYTDSNQIRDLPRELFYCHGLRKLSISDNEITTIPPAIAGLDHLEELDFSKNGIIDVPDNIKCCKYLRVIDASVNPLGKLPDGFTQLQNLTHLYLNDTFLDYLPGSFGRLVKLKMVEMRENHLKTLPKSFGRLTELERLDIGNNEFTELPDVVGSLTKLLELWCDNNQMTSLTHTMGGLQQLIFLDASNNQLSSLPGEIEGCSSLADLHLTSNQLHSLPHTIGSLSCLTTLKVDDNQLTSLPPSMGGLASLSELNVSVNDLEDLPSSIGLLRNLRTFYADENLLTFVPAELGSCSGITVLSLRSNKLTYIPDELGRIPRLRVLNLSDNQLACLPFTIVKLKELQALWLTENQTRPLIPLQSDYEAETGRKILTCYLLPQGNQSPSDTGGGDGDDDSFQASLWEEQRLQRQHIHFSFDEDDDDQGHLVRCPTPYPKEMREKARHMRNLALRQTVSDSTQQPSRSPKSQHSHRQGRTSYLGSEEDVTSATEIRPSPSPGPSLQETHRLYRCDKEKLMRDKARMQHSQSLPTDVAAYTNTAGSNRGDSVSGPSDTEEGRVAGRRKSTPNLFSFEGGASNGQKPRRMPSFTYEDLYQKQILRKHHHRGRRSRRMREYDSDTGYRSDREVSIGRRDDGDFKDDLSVRSQPTMSRSHRHGREGGGYTSDLEAYAGRGRGGFGRGSGRSSAAPTPKPRTIQQQQPAPYSTAGSPQDLNTHSSSADAAQNHVTSPFRPQSCLTVPSLRPDSGNQQYNAASASASPTHAVQDQSRQVTSQRPEDIRSPDRPPDSSRYSSRQAADYNDSSLQADLYNAMLEEHNKITAVQSQKPIPAKRLSPTVRQIPPPYHPAPPYRRASDRASERSDSSSGIPRSPRDSDLGSSSFSNPEYRAVGQCSREGSDSSEALRGGDRSYRESTDNSEVFQTSYSDRDGGSHMNRAYREDGSASVEAVPPERKYSCDRDRVNRAYREDGSASVEAVPPERKYSGDRDGGSRVNRAYREDGDASSGAVHPERKYSDANRDGGSRVNRPYREDGGSSFGDLHPDRQYREGVGDGSRVSSDKQYNQSPAPMQERTESTPSPSQQYRTPPQKPVRRTAHTPYTYGYGQGGRTGWQDGSVRQGGSSSSSSVVQGSGAGQEESNRVEGGSGQGVRTTYEDSSSVGVVSHSDSRPSGRDFPVSPHGAPAIGRGSSSYYTPHPRPLSARTSPSYPDHRSRDNLTPVRAQYAGHSNRTHSPHLPYTTPYRARAGSREDVLEGQPSGAVHQSPTPSSSQKASYPSSTPRMLATYPSPYGEPLEVGDPLMRRYEDVALFKIMQDPCQVSSSTDSGYGQGHPIYERIGDFSAKRSGSPYSSTPSHRGTPVRGSSSSQGTVSRGNTPVREESFYAGQGTGGPSALSRDVFRTVLHKKPGLGFSIAGGAGCQDLNPFRAGDSGIFVTKVQAEGPAASLLQPGDKLLKVNHVDFTNIDHTSAVNVLKTASSVDLLVERVQKINMV